jgi:hypothetical protein
LIIFEPEGTLTVNLIKKSYIPGEVVKGTVKLFLDQPVKARRLLISLTGEEWVNVSCGGGKNRRYKKEETKIHTEEIEFSGEDLYTIVEKNFQFKIPENAPPSIWMNPKDSTLKNKHRFSNALKSS